jgi:hypothetical protein
MGNPLDSLKRQPWRPLLLSAGLATIGLRALEAVLAVVMLRSRLWQEFLASLFEGPLGLMVVLLIYVGLGALAVLLLETKFSPGRIYVGTLWTLVLCIILSLLGLWLIQIFVPIPGLGLVGANEQMLLVVVVGVFLKGQRHWRY